MPATKKSIELTKQLLEDEKELARMEKVRAEAKKKNIKLTAEEETAYVKLKVSIDETREASEKFADATSDEFKELKKEVDDYNDSLSDKLAKATKTGGKAQKKFFKNTTDRFSALIEERKKVDLAGGDTTAFDQLLEAGNEFLGATEMTADQAEAFQKTLSDIDLDKLGDIGADLAGDLGAAADAMGFQDAIMDSLNLKSITLSGTIIAVAESMADAAESAAQMQSELGIASDQALALNMNLKSAAFSMLGLGDSLRGAQGAALGALDSVKAMSDKSLINQFMFMENAFGVSAEQGAELTNTMMNLTGASAKQAALTVESAAALAKANDVAPGKVIEEMASNAEMLSKFSDGTAEGMARAAIQAAKMGVELSKVGQVMDGLLDLETSLTNEFEASVLLGKELNFDRARQLALNNDIEGAMNEILGQLGSEEEFNKMNAIQRQALADSIGVGVEDLASMVNRDAAVDGGLADYSSKAEKSILDILLKSNSLLGTMLKAISTGIAGFGGFKLLTKYFGKGGMLIKGFKKTLTAALGKIALPLTILMEAIQNISLLFGGGKDDKAKGAGGLVGAGIGGGIGALLGGPIGAAIGVSVGGFLGRKLGPILAESGVGEAFKTYFSGVGAALKPAIDRFGAIIDKVRAIFEGPGSIGQKIGSAIGELIINLPGMFINLGSAVVGVVVSSLKLLWQLPGEIGKVLLDVGKSIFSAVTSTLSDVFSTMFTKVIGAIKGGLNTALDKVRSVEVFGFKPFDGLPRLKDGGSITSGGMAMVGEKGPEIAALPAGAQVASNNAFKGMMSLSDSSKRSVELLSIISADMKRAADGISKLQVSAGA